MHINQLSLSHVRNLEKVSLGFSPTLNIFYGPNAAGKSSVLEALYYLGNGRSFRTAKHNKIINDNYSDFIIFSNLVSSGVDHKLGMSRNRSGEISIKLDSEPVKRLSTLAKLFPVQLLSPEQYDLLVKGPGARRKQLDWGVFHVEHSVLGLWQKVQKILKHRNELLKKRVQYSEVTAWDKQLVTLSLQVTQLREAYCDKIRPIFKELSRAFLSDIDVDIELYPGWTDKGNNGLAAIYESQFNKDRQLGFTQSSIHKADLKFYIDEKKRAGDYLSRGQQKLLITVFKLAQLQIMQQYGKQTPLFLLDDIGAELDTNHQELLLQILSEQPQEQQIFITCVHLEPLTPLIKRYNEAKVFHVEHGVVKAIDEL
ncbi:DNA replication/repair protein RecF [Kangiella sediminilitoris]|uniref:DNA replication and repair protein RecF n=1 Tax=Kangiella sediminilitoris TaxID=1144748 RepID=A0A1B3B7H1_9GAMM|nr:DNA replication/repair protein RecF [Kangiella sediminilitoris]AOE48735.1 DNA replication and repair protein RecF [Kangiella sediminilitoris]